MKAEWINLDKFNYRRTGRKVGIPPLRRDVYLIHCNGLMFRDTDGTIYRTHGDSGYSDGGTIPWPFSRFLPRDEYMESYWFHDQGCKYGGFWSVIEETPERSSMQFVDMTRKQLDEMLVRMIEASPNKGTIDKTAIYAGVRVGAWLGVGKPAKNR